MDTQRALIGSAATKLAGIQRSPSQRALFSAEEKTGDSQSFQTVQPFKAVGPQALDPVVVQVPAEKTETLKWGRTHLVCPLRSLRGDSGMLGELRAGRGRKYSLQRVRYQPR